MKNKMLAESIVRNSFYNFLAKIIERLASLVLIIILARFLLPEAFGIYSIALSLAIIISAFMDLGMGEALTRYVAYEVGRKNNKKAAAYFDYLLKRKVYIGLISGALVLIFAWPIAVYIFRKPELIGPFLAVSIYVTLTSLDPFIQRIFYIFNNAKILSIKEIIFEPLKILFILLIFKFVPYDKVTTLLLFFAFSTMIVTLVLFFISKSKYCFLFEKSNEKFDKKKLLKFIGFMVLASFATLLFGYIDVLLIGALIPDESYAGYYRAAFGLVYSLSGLITFTSILYPVFAKYKREQIKKIFFASFRYSFIITVPISFGLAFLSNYFLRTIYGYAYLPASETLAILSFTIIFVVGTEILGSFFNAQEKPGFLVRLLIISSILNVILNLGFIITLSRISFKLAIIGAAIATLLSRTFYFFGMWIETKRIFNLSIRTKDIFKPLLAGIVMLLVLYLFNHYAVRDMNLIFGIVDVLLGAFVYLAMLILTKGVSKNDLDLLKRGFIIPLDLKSKKRCATPT